MLTAELLAQVRRIEIKTGRLVNETFAGKYLSAFKGHGMEFAQVREYVPGDDIRTIDWNVTARSSKPFVREYQEERELTLVVACDLSGSQFFGSTRRFKREAAAELSAVLAFAALKNNDKVGCLLFSDGAERFIPPRKGHKHALAIVRDLLAFEPERRGTDIASSLDTLNRLLHRRSIIVLVSDFQSEGFEKAFRRTAKKHDLIPVLIEDPRESTMPNLGAYIELEDAETGSPVLFDAGSKSARDQAAKDRREAREKLDSLFTSAGVEPIVVRTDEPVVDPVVRFFRRRALRFR